MGWESSMYTGNASEGQRLPAGSTATLPSVSTSR